jgi:predicted GNAT family N-acyltransferase
MLGFFKRFGKKKETEPAAAGAGTEHQTLLVIEIYDDTHPIWKEFATEVKPARANKKNKEENEEANEGENEYENYLNEFAVDYTVPGDLAYELAGLCEREGAIELDAQKIMYFSESTNKLLLLKKNGELIGFLMLALYGGSSDAKIWLVCVSSSEKGKQYSKYLIGQAKQMAIDAGKTSIHLEALSRKVGSKVYKKQGFTFNNSNSENMTAFLEQPQKRKTRRNRPNRRVTRRNQRRQQ